MVTGNVCSSYFQPYLFLSNDQFICDTNDRKQEKKSRKSFTFCNDDSVSG